MITVQSVEFIPKLVLWKTWQQEEEVEKALNATAQLEPCLEIIYVKKDMSEMGLYVFRKSTWKDLQWWIDFAF